MGVARYVWLTEGGTSQTLRSRSPMTGRGEASAAPCSTRLAYRARQDGVRRFSALVQSDNRASLGLLTAFGDTHEVSDAGQSELLIELPAKRGIGGLLARALSAAAAGALVPAQTMAHRFPRIDGRDRAARHRE